LVDISAGDLEYYRPKISFWKNKKYTQMQKPVYYDSIYDSL
jgi:hypothetical protein